MSDKSKAQKYKRSYSQKTLKILFALSRNQCAEPNCSNPVILPKTEFDDEAVSAQIAHIYAVNDDGPRGKPGLTQSERNHHHNLLLLCPTHHVAVDQQFNTYPAKLLQKWKSDHERSLPQSLIENLILRFQKTDPETSETDVKAFLEAKAVDYYEMRQRLAELSETDEKLSQFVLQATTAIDQGDFSAADDCLEQAEILQFESNTKGALKRQADFRLERGNTALLRGDVDSAALHFEKAAGLFSGVSRDEEALTRHANPNVHLREYIALYFLIPVIRHLSLKKLYSPSNKVDNTRPRRSRVLWIEKIALLLRSPHCGVRIRPTIRGCHGKVRKRAPVAVHWYK